MPRRNTEQDFWKRVSKSPEVGIAAKAAKKTHYPQGHPYDMFNTRYYDGRRYCRTCISKSANERKRVLRSNLP